MISFRKTPRLMPALFAVGLALMGLLIGVMLVTTPDQLGPFGITIWFVAGMLSVAAMVSGIIYFFLWWLNRPNPKRTALQIGGVFGGYLTALVALNSLRQLDLKDIVLVSLLVLLAGFYLRKV